ncbi:MAG: zinc metalloprotease HtpX [Candidatus Palauibacterales bacterium]|nr:zinc metalloprotease HtpX [Candidatus Palauibacterales bacterium]MDP2483468.1 zinc metalloprotease HtpX [Candidatus Palauibacterales bacterium]
MSYVKTFGLMALMTALFMAIAGWFGGRSAMMFALAFAVVFNFGAYWFSDRAVLRMYRARPLERNEAPGLYDMVDDLRKRAGLPMPAVAISASPQPNAFATGRDPAHAVVCVTQGMLQVASADELAGVIGHELAHVKNRDMLIGTVAATLSAAVVMLARFGFWFGGDDDRGGLLSGLLMLILAPLAAMLIQMAISRTAEYRADRIGAEISGRPDALASALLKLEAEARRKPMQLNPSAAHLAIVNPLRTGGLSRLFRTHPPTEERVRRLEEIARRGV